MALALLMLPPLPHPLVLPHSPPASALPGCPTQQDVTATALEISHGLAYLHSPRPRLVHRDLSAANVLLNTADNSRGFRALVSDFGLSAGGDKCGGCGLEEGRWLVGVLGPGIHMPFGRQQVGGF